MFRIRNILLLFVLNCVGVKAFEPYRIEDFSPQDPLCSVSVPNILQDSKGFIWFGTQGGIDRYDGYQLGHIRFPDELGSFDNVRSFCEDNSGNIWICSAKGICIWERGSGRVRHYYSGDVSNIVKSADGNLWVAAYRAGFLKINPDTGVCDTLYQVDNPRARHFGNNIRYDGEDTVWLLNGRGEIMKCRMDSKCFEIVVPFSESPLPALDVTSFYYMDGMLICGKRGRQKGYVYDIRSGHFHSHPLGFIYGCGATPDGGRFLVTPRGVEYFPKGIRGCVESGVWDGTIIADSRVQAVCIDRDGRFWLGTKEDGVLCMVPNIAEFETIVDGLQISCVESGHEGHVWIGTVGGGLLKYSPTDGSVKRISIPSDNVSSLGHWGDKLAVATSNPAAPLVLLNNEGKIVKTITGLQPNLSCLLEYSPNVLWFGGYLHAFDKSDRSVKRIENVNTVLKAIVRDSDGRNWVATSFGGVWMEDKRRWKYYSDSSRAAMHTTDLYSDGKYIWITSSNDGLQRLDPKSGEIRSYQEFGGVPCHRLTGIARDSSGCLWLAASNGFALLDPSTGHTAMYTPQNGPDAQQYVFSIIKYIGGRMYIGSHKGLMSFDPHLFKTVNLGRGRIVFTDFAILNSLKKTQPVKEEKSFDIDSKNNIKLHAKENSFIIGCSQMDYVSPRSTNLEFCLTGYNDGWQPVEKGRITVAGLPPGRYSLCVRLVGRATGQVIDTRTLNISVALPRMLSVPTILIYILLLSGIIVLIVLLTRRSTFRKAEENALREAELREAENQKRLYASKVEFLTTIAHEIRTPLTLVRTPVESLRKKLANAADKSVLKDLDVVGSNAGRLSDLLDELLDFRKLENSSVHLDPAEYDIVALIRSIAGRFTLAARRKRIDFTLSLPDTPISASVDKNAFDKIVSNLLSNAIKYCATFVKVKMDSDINGFRVVLENDGAVVPLQERDRIFRPFERYLPQGSVESGTGIGLFVSRNLAELHNGELAMDGDGSINRFILTIPIVHMAYETAKMGLPDIHIPQERPTLMIVEDNDELLDFLSRQFSLQYAVITATNGADALKLIKENPFNMPDCIISDVVMPVMDGYEFCRTVKNDKEICHIPVILLTALGDNDSRLSGLEDGADAYVSKPFSSEELIVLVANLLKNRERIGARYNGFVQLPVRPSATADSPDARMLRTIDSYIQGHLTDETLGVEALAEVACVSVTTLYKKIKHLLGISPSEYIILVRLKQASLYLKNSKATISEIAVKTGFSSPSYFSYRFKSQFGVTPKEYRAKTDS